MRLNVRCCCHPTKILGTFEVTEQQVRERRFVLLQPATGSPFDPMEDGSAEATSHVILIKQFMASLRCIEDAIYSEERPVEFWRQFEQFEETKA